MNKVYLHIFDIFPIIMHLFAFVHLAKSLLISMGALDKHSGQTLYTGHLSKRQAFLYGQFVINWNMSINIYVTCSLSLDVRIQPLDKQIASFIN